MIVLASDHAGFELRKKLENWFSKIGVKFVSVGAINFESLDSYVTYAKLGVDYYKKNCDEKTDKLILICGSGIGMSITANRDKNIRAVLAYSKVQAYQSRLHNDCNCLCLGGRNTSFLKAKGIIKAFFNTQFLGGKYLDRINSIDKI